MNKRVLITGASSGLGLEMAKIFAKNAHPLVLIARRENRLRELAAELKKNFNVEVYVIAKDLSQKNAALEIYEELRIAGIQIKMLVNNAGFGDHGEFSASNLVVQDHMIQVNVNALVALTRLFLPEMIENRYGGILNVASVAGFQPGPYMSVYYATKAFVLSFSDALSYELKNTGVWVTTLCPGATKTEFESTAKASKLFENMQVAKAYDVALFAYKSFMAKKGIVVFGAFNKVMTILQKFSPRWILKKVVANVQR